MKARQNISSPFLRWQTVAVRLFTCLILSTSAVAQYRTDIWTTDDGLPQNSVTGLTKMRDGYIWLTTSDGLVRFDGARFTVFNKSNTPEVSNNRLAKAFGDQSGRLWFQGEDGSIIDYEKGAFSVAVKPNVIAPDSHGVFFDDQTGGVVFYANNQNCRYQNGELDFNYEHTICRRIGKIIL